MAKLERTYNVPLRKGFMNTARHKRAKKAGNVLRDFLKKHMKADEVKIGQHLNHHIWKNGIKNPPHHVKVKAVKDDDGVAKAELEGFDYTETVRPEEPQPEEGFAQKLAGKMGSDKKEATSSEKEESSDKEIPSRSTVEAMTKDEIKDYAKKEFDVELSTDNLKKEMVDNFFKEVK